MPERGGVQKTVIAAGLICVGASVAWLGLALAVGTVIGLAIRNADRAEGTGEAVDTVADLEEIWAANEAADEDAVRPLLGVVHPREP
jgi:hypothetical protein